MGAYIDKDGVTWQLELHVVLSRRHPFCAESADTQRWQNLTKPKRVHNSGACSEGVTIANNLDVKIPGTIEEDLHGLVAKQRARFFLDHNAEPDAVDLLEELEIINEITRR